MILEMEYFLEIGQFLLHIAILRLLDDACLHAGLLKGNGQKQNRPGGGNNGPGKKRHFLRTVTSENPKSSFYRSKETNEVVCSSVVEFRFQEGGKQ